MSDLFELDYYKDASLICFLSMVVEMAGVEQLTPVAQKLHKDAERFEDDDNLRPEWSFLSVQPSTSTMMG